MEFDKEKKYLCMLAPSFVALYDYPNIVYRLRALGFEKVVEVTFGAKMTNVTITKFLKREVMKEHGLPLLALLLLI